MILRGAPPNKANEVVRDQILAFMGAGQVTVAGTLTWAISLLVRHPDILARVTEEIQTVLQGSAPTGRDLTKMTYLDWVVKETLRLYPAVWLHGRVAKEDVEIDGWFLPKGTNVFFSEWVTQRAEEYFSEPLRFAPERFAPVSSFVHNSDAYIPWGMGPRACIGAGFATLEAKVVLSMLLPRFTPALVDPNERLEPTPRSILLQPRGAVRMRMEPAPMRRLELAHAN
jgi:cytochrome P450